MITCVIANHLVTIIITRFPAAYTHRVHAMTIFHVNGLFILALNMVIHFDNEKQKMPWTWEKGNGRIRRAYDDEFSAFGKYRTAKLSGYIRPEMVRTMLIRFVVSVGSFYMRIAINNSSCSCSCSCVKIAPPPFAPFAPPPTSTY